MIGLDTNVLARYDIDDAGDVEAKRQRTAARRLIELPRLRQRGSFDDRRFARHAKKLALAPAVVVPR